MCGVTTWNVIMDYTIDKYLVCVCMRVCEQLNIMVFKLGPGMYRSVVNQMLNCADMYLY